MKGIKTTALTAFVFLGLFGLAWQTYSDFKKKEVDSRRNWFMFGVVITIVLLEGVNFWFYLAAIIGTVLFTARIKKMYADGDIEALRWIMPGFLVLNWAFGLTYFVAFTLLSVIWFVSHRALKIREETPGFPILIGAFVITAALAFGI